MNKIRNDIVGQRFERLVAIERITKNSRGYYKCLCDCGNVVVVRADRIKEGRTKSCGCYNRDKAKTGDARRVHGKHGTRLYVIWQNMHSRCYTKTNKFHKNYGGRGITICDEWLHDFQTFYDWAMANGYHNNLTIDRIDVNGNYEPSNCRWITKAEQTRNKRTNRFIIYKNETHTISEWGRIVGIDASLISWRLRHNWTTEKALTTKPNQKTVS